MKRTFIAFVFLPALALASSVLFPRGVIQSLLVRDPYTSPANLILNRLRAIDRAKEQWVRDHPDIHPDALSEQDLAPYLSGSLGKQLVAGERYFIHGVGEPPETVMTRDVDWIPKGTAVRFSPDQVGKIEVRSNNDLHWTAL